MPATARRLAMIAAAVATTVMAACTNPVAPTSQLTASGGAEMNGGYLGSVGRDTTTTRQSQR